MPMLISESRMWQKISLFITTTLACSQFSYLQDKEKTSSNFFYLMASLRITAIQRTCSSNHLPKILSTQSRPVRSLGTTNIMAPSIDSLKVADKQEMHLILTTDNAKVLEHEIPQSNSSVESSEPKFSDERWKKGTWDLNMFVKQGKMDWDSVIVAEARRRKFLELHPESSTNEDPVLFRSSIIPWWAWIVHSHLPEAEMLNGRAAMIGFFMAYAVDGLTGLNIVGQTGNFICKAAMLATIIGILVFRRKEDFENIQKLADEATFYDKQWQASWQNAESSNTEKK